MTSPVRWTMSEDGGANYFPVDAGAVEIERATDFQNIGGRAIRYRLTADVQFSTKSTYQRLWHMRRSASVQCTAIYLREEQLCATGWVVLWTGFFHPTWVNFNHDHCLCSVRPRPVDKYTCLESVLEERVNVLQAGAQNAKAYIPASLEWAMYRRKTIVEGTFPDAITCVHEKYDPGIVPADLTNYSLAHSHTINPGPLEELIRIYWREVRVTPCVGGAPVPPSGLGWTLLEDNCSTDGTSKWWRTPLISYTFGDSTTGGDCAAGTEEVLVGLQGFSDEFAGTPTDDCSGPIWWPNRYVCFLAENVVFGRARLLSDVFDFMLAGSECDGMVVVSDFLEIRAPGDTAGFVAGKNYVTGADNQLDALCLLANSDVSDPTASEPADKLETSLSAVLKSLCDLLCMEWDVDNDGNLRIEHVKHWLTGPAEDVSGSSDATEVLRLVSMTAEAPRRERFTTENAFETDFVGQDIVYNEPCASGGDETESTAIALSTDVGQMYFRPESVDENGLTLVATYIDSLNERTIYNAIGAISGFEWINAPLSIANLHRDYFGWNRYLISGTVNSQPTTFDRARATNKQEGIVLRLCCDIDRWMYARWLYTRMSYLLGTQPVRGEIAAARYNPAEGTLNIVATYSF